MDAPAPTPAIVAHATDARIDELLTLYVEPCCRPVLGHVCRLCGLLKAMEMVCDSILDNPPPGFDLAAVEALWWSLPYGRQLIESDMPPGCMEVELPDYDHLGQLGQIYALLKDVLSEADGILQAHTEEDAEDCHWLQDVRCIAFTTPILASALPDSQE